MIFQTRNFVFLLLTASFVLAEDTNKPGVPTLDNKAADVHAPTSSDVKDLQPTPAPATSTSSITTGPTTTTTTETPTTTTTQAPTTSTTTPKPDPTTPTTPKPSPTTPTTTPKPAPTTPITTPKPAPPSPTPTPAKNESWVVFGSNGTACISANMVIKISVPFMTKNNRTEETTFRVEKVENATANGTCAAPDKSQELVLTWSNVTATFKFAINGSSHLYSLESIKINIPVNNVTFPNNTMINVTEVELMYNKSLFSVPQNNSYTCTTVPLVHLSGATFPLSNATINGTLTIAHVHVQAFGTTKETKFRAPMDCASTETPDIVPIAVGLILAGLVVIVLVAYLVGRRRAQARGYLSM